MKRITAEGEIVEYQIHEPIPMDGPFFKTPHNHDRDYESEAHALKCTDESKTQQQFSSEADINNILAKFLNTGQVMGNPKLAYLDVDKEFDLQDSIVTAYQVEQAWNELPTAVRNILKEPKVFVEYVEHCMETGDLEPLRELGLAKPLPTDPPETSGVTPEPPKT